MLGKLLQAKGLQHTHQQLMTEAPLTPREREIFPLVTEGMLNKQIGYKLGIVEKTVKVHRARIMEKMQAESLADLVHMADKIGIPPQKT